MPRERDQNKAAPKPSANRKKAVSFLRLPSVPSADQTTVHNPRKGKVGHALELFLKKRKEETKDPVFPGFLVHYFSKNEQS